MAEAVMLRLGTTIGRQRAHDIVYDAAQAAATTGRPFRELLSEDATIAARLKPEEVDTLLDPAGYTGLCAQFAVTGAGRARSVADAIETDAGLPVAASALDRAADGGRTR